MITERVRRAASSSMWSRSSSAGGTISRSLSSLSQRVCTPRLPSTSSSRLTSSIRATLRSVVRPRLSSEAHSSATPAFLEVLTSMLPERVVGPVTRRWVGPAPSATISESRAAPIRASISSERFWWPALDPVDRALARREQLGELLLGEPAVLARVADEVPDPALVVVPGHGAPRYLRYEITQHSRARTTGQRGASPATVSRPGGRRADHAPARIGGCAPPPSTPPATSASPTFPTRCSRPRPTRSCGSSPAASAAPTCGPTGARTRSTPARRSATSASAWSRRSAARSATSAAATSWSCRSASATTPACTAGPGITSACENQGWTSTGQGEYARVVHADGSLVATDGMPDDGAGALAAHALRRDGDRLARRRRGRRAPGRDRRRGRRRCRRACAACWRPR